MNTINNSTVTMKKHYINELAYFDSFSGMIPCKVINIESDNKITIKITCNHGAYRRGEVRTDNTLHIVPRESVHHNRIVNNYQWIKK
jgi:hypothetical protein